MERKNVNKNKKGNIKSMKRKPQIGSKAFAKMGAKQRWGSRYDTLVELSKLIDKKELNWMQAKWKTTHLSYLLEVLRK